MTFERVYQESVAYSADVPAKRHITTQLELDDDLKNIELMIKITCAVTTTGATFQTYIPAKNLPFAMIRELKLAVAGSKEIISPKGEQLVYLHALFNRDEHLYTALPTSTTSSADYHQAVRLNNIGVLREKGNLNVDIELADVADIASTIADLDITAIEITILFEYGKPSMSLLTNRADGMTFSANSSKKVKELETNKRLLAIIVDAYSSDLIDMTNLKLLHQGRTMLNTESPYEYQIKNLKNFHSLLALTDYENVYAIVPENVLGTDNSTKFSAKFSATKTGLVDILFVYSNPIQNIGD